MVQEVADNIFKIAAPLHNSPLKLFNVYLIRGKDRNLLIDNGFGTTECFEALIAGLRKTGASLDATEHTRPALGRLSRSPAMVCHRRSPGPP